MSVIGVSLLAAFELNSSWRNTYPYTAIVHILVEWPDGYGWGTGALVGKNDILTATHVIYSPELGGWPTKIRVSFGSDFNGINQNFDETPKNSFVYGRGEFGALAYPSGSFVDASHGTMRSSESQHDVAMIAISDPIGLDVGWFGMATGRDSPRVSKSVGYPYTGTGMMYEQVRVVGHPFLDIYYANTSVMAPGASGGPLFDSDNYIIGVRSSGSSTRATWADLDLHYNELVDYIASNDHFLDKDRILTLAATSNTADEGEQVTFKLYDSIASRGDQVRYDISGVTAKDISLADAGGYLTFDNNGFATLLVKIEEDNWTEGKETLIFTANGKVANVLINDTSTTPSSQSSITVNVSPPKSRSTLKKLVVAHDNSVYVVGQTDSTAINSLYDHAKQSLFVSHYSSQGEMLWSKTFGSYELDYADGAIVDNANNVYILCDVGSWAPGRPQIGMQDILLTKLNSQGDLVWEKIFGSVSRDYSLDIRFGPEEKIYMIYGGGTNTIHDSQSTLLKIDTNGNIENTIDTTVANAKYSHKPVAFVIDFDGSVITFSSNDIFSYDSSGVLQWKQALQGTPSYDSEVVLGLDGSLYVEGVRSLHSGNETVQKYSSEGVFIWEKSIGGTGSQTLGISNNGNVFVAGFSNGSNGFYEIPSHKGRQVWYVSFDQNGNYISSKAFDGMNAEDIETTKNGDVLLGVTGFGGSLNYTKINSTQNTSTTLFIESSQNMILEGGVAQFKITSTGLTEGTKVGYGVWLSGGKVLSTKGVTTIDADGKALINVTSVVDNKYDIDTSLVVTTMFGSAGIFVRDTTPLSGDENYAIRTDDIGQQAYRIYEAAFNRDPDPRGLGYWISQFDNGMRLIEVSSRFIDSNEFKAIYGTNPTNATFITNLYLNVLDRAPDDAGLVWWVDQLDNNSEKTWQKVLADFSESPENIENNRLELVGRLDQTIGFPAGQQGIRCM